MVPFPAPRPIYMYGRQVTTLLVKCPLWVSQLGKLSLPSLQGRKMSSTSCIYVDYGAGDWFSVWLYGYCG